MHRKHELDALIFFFIYYYFYFLILLKLTEIGSLDCQTNAIFLFDFLSCTDE